MIEAKAISLTRSGRSILSHVDFDLRAGEFVALIGPNGAGKTSLMRSLMKLDANATGDCNLWQMGARARAQFAGWLAQERGLAWDMRVEDVVALGRTAWQGWGLADAKRSPAVDQALSRMQLEDFRSRRFHNLSGGERARVLIARVLAQETEVIIADEPIDALDPAHQIHTMELFQALAKEGKGVLISIHDLGLAARFCSRLVLIDQGKKIVEGGVSEVLSDANLQKVFGVEVYRGERDGPIIQPIKTVEV